MLGCPRATTEKATILLEIHTSNYGFTILNITYTSQSKETNNVIKLLKRRRRKEPNKSETKNSHILMMANQRKDQEVKLKQDT